MTNPRAMGLPPLIFGVFMLESSVRVLLGAPIAWANPSWLLSIPGTVFGLAATLLGIAIVLQVDNLLMNDTVA